MGYTHYFGFQIIPKGQVKSTELAYQAALDDCTKIVKAFHKVNGGLSGYTAHAPARKYDGIKVNGSERAGFCEDFCLAKTFRDNDPSNFCKTSRLEYDAVVTACLIVLKARLGDLFSVGSDGYADAWGVGLQLAQRVLNRPTLKLPETLSKRGLRVAS